MDATRSRIWTGNLLVAVAALLVGCTTGGTTTQTGTNPTSPSASTDPRNPGLLPVWHRAPSPASDDSDGLVERNLDRIGFVDTSGKLVAEPTYVRHLLCPGPQGTLVFRTTTGHAFDVPAPFHAMTDSGWNPGGDAFVVCESDNGLRLVLDATGAVTPLATVEQAVTTDDNTVYYWAYAGDQQGWVDATGAWIYRESRYQITED